MRKRRRSLNQNKNREPGELCSVALALAITVLSVKVTCRFTSDKGVDTGKGCNLSEIAANCLLESACESFGAILLG